MDTTLEEAFDELYAAAPEDFVAERARLAKALKENGLADDAKAVAAVRKPTVAAWALNQLSRNNRRETDLLLDAGHRLARPRRAHSRAPNEMLSSTRAKPSEKHSPS